MRTLVVYLHQELLALQHGRKKPPRKADEMFHDIFWQRKVSSLFEQSPENTCSCSVFARSRSVPCLCGPTVHGVFYGQPREKDVRGWEEKGDDLREGEEEEEENEAGEDDGVEEEVTRHMISTRGGGVDRRRKMRR